ncbi:TPA: macro domain-containing protein [Salmonella enterica subsp. enterica serovar Java]
MVSGRAEASCYRRAVRSPGLWGETRIMLYLRKGDITRFSGDVIVNAASTRLHHGGGVCGAIHRAAGPELLAACRNHIRSHGSLPAGEVILTPPGKLPCRGVIHAVGPRWLFGAYAERQDGLLAQAYFRALRLARDNGFLSIAFPCISIGYYFYPHESAKWRLNRSKFGIPADHDLAFISDRDLAVFFKVVVACCNKITLCRLFFWVQINRLYVVPVTTRFAPALRVLLAS